MRKVNYGKVMSTKTTPQSEPIPGKNQVKNNAGGYVFEVDDWGRLDRFLILGSESPTYYTSARKLTKENANVVLKCIQSDGIKTVNRIVEISDAGRAPKNDPALFCLAMCASFGNDKTKSYALECLPKVARTGTFLFKFVDYASNMRGWGRGLKRAVANWYLNKTPDNLAYQVIKYQQRDGWSNRDLLRLSHPKSEELNSIFKWIVNGEVDRNCPSLIHGIEAAKKAENEKNIISIIQEYKLPWEAIPTEFLGSSNVWNELLPNLPMTALLRNLGRLTANGTLKHLSKNSSFVCDKLTNDEFIKKARIHPLSVLVALKTYESGKGLKGSLSWNPISTVSDALDDMYYKAFNYVEPTGKNILIGVDVSGSMSYGNIGGMPISPCVGAAAMAMTVARTEKNYHIMGFCHEFVDLHISARDSLNDATKKAQKHNFGGTDCALPMLWAMKNEVDVDAFVVITDNETWYNKNIHPIQALQKYRSKYGKGKLIVIGMTASGFSIADPDDEGMMDLVGFDTACPQLISDFIRQ